MRSPRIEGPPVLQPVTESASVSLGNRDSIETPIDESASDDGNAATPPMPVLVEGEDFCDDDATTFDLLPPAEVVSKLDAKSDGTSEAPPLLTNGLGAEEKETEIAPTIAYDGRVNGDHEEPVLEKFFRLFTPSAQPLPEVAVPSTSVATPPATPKRRRPYAPRRKAEERSPAAKRARVKQPVEAESQRGRKRGPKPKEAPKAPSALENRYMRSPYIVSTTENDSIMSRFEVVNPAFRDAASVRVTEQPFKHAMKLPPHAGLAKSAWVCVFCGLGTTFAKLGCLFGPYYIDFNKFTAHADLIALAKPSPDLGPAEEPKEKASKVSREAVREEKEEEAAEKGASVKEAGQDEEEDEEAVSRRRIRRTIRGPNNTATHSSISSFRRSKAQPLMDAKDVRRLSCDSDSAAAHVKQVDIASVFFSSDQPPTDKKNNDKKKADAKASEKKTDAKSSSDTKTDAKSSSDTKTDAKSSEKCETKQNGKDAVKRSARPQSPAKSKPKRSVGRPPKEGKEPKEVKQAPAANNNNTCQAKANKASDSRASFEKCTDTRIAANGEAWTHLECVLWASGTYLNGKQIVGLEDALSEALQTVCKVCNLRGAMLACVQRGCDRVFHYYCAIEDCCHLDYEQFCLYCSRHKKKNASQMYLPSKSKSRKERSYW